jgi:hypothetical protein
MPLGDIALVSGGAATSRLTGRPWRHGRNALRPSECTTALALLDDKIAVIDARIAELQRVRATLSQVLCAHFRDAPEPTGGADSPT